MAYDLQSTHQIYQRSVAAMATSNADLRDRLLEAYRKHARSAYRENSRDVPIVLYERMAALHQRLTAGGPGPEGSIAKTIHAMDDDEVESAAAELVAIAQAIDQATW